MFTNVNLTIMDNRFKIWMEHKQINASNLADNININKATISHILSGRNKPIIDFLTKLLKVYPNFNTNWLISGQGYMSMQKSKEDIISKSVKKITIFYNDASFEEVIN